MDPFHQQLARIAFEAAEDFGLVLAGGYAISAHHLTSRPSRDLDFATVSTLPLDVITDRLAGVYRDAGYDVQVIETAPTMARFEVHAAHIRGGYSLRELERLGAAHLPRFTLGELLDRLDSVEFLDDETFTAYGLTDDDLAALHHWSRSWADDLRTRVAAEDIVSRTAPGDPDWDTYLDD